MFEPINSFGSPEPGDRWCGYDVTPVRELAAKVKARRSRDDRVVVGWDERDVLRWLEAAGFDDVDVSVEYEVKPRPMTGIVTWDAFRNHAPNPLSPTLQEAMDDALTREEQERFVVHVRPLVERGEGSYRMASAYIRALKT
jgi:hypothetical protein